MEWEKGQKSLHEFEQMLKAVFQSAHKYIRLKVVKEGSLKLICECPEWIQGALICQIREKEPLLREYGVMEITVGEIIVVKKNTVVSYIICCICYVMQFIISILSYCYSSH